MNSESVKIGKCQNRNMSKSERVKIEITESIRLLKSQKLNV